jgi:hypothetical protein
MASRAILDGYSVGDTLPRFDFEIGESIAGKTIAGRLIRPDGTESAALTGVVDQPEPGPDPDADPAKFHFDIIVGTLTIPGMYDLRVTFTVGIDVETWSVNRVEVSK